MLLLIDLDVWWFDAFLTGFLPQLFDTTLRYIHIGHANSDLEIAKTFIDTLAKNEPTNPIWQTGQFEDLRQSGDVKSRIGFYKGILGVVFIYILLFGRIFIIQPCYVYLNNKNTFNWKNIRILHVVLFLLLCWMFFYLPIHREYCPSGRSGMLCSNLGDDLKYIAFPARIMLYWSIILFFINHFLNDVLNKGNQNGDGKQA